GWSYYEWNGGFYPADLPAGDRLRYLAERFDTVEVNGTFYSLTNPAAVRRWREQTPARFVFAVKGSRYITHTKRLSDPARAIANFLASGLLDLGTKLGPILWQFPPSLAFEPEAVERFLRILPHDTTEAVALARDHDDRVDDVSYGDGSNHRMRHVIEFRHPSFFGHDAVSLVRRHGLAIACSHSSEWPLAADVTAGFVYVRLHGPGVVYASGYDDMSLREWARRAHTWRAGGDVQDLETVSNLAAPQRDERDVYVYFDNTAEGHAPSDAGRLRDLIGSR
ncbi:MAG: DUF72 domain-containing protein, partial [Acidimicrobiia bacterium]